jgi:dihydropyrimidinase
MGKIITTTDIYQLKKAGIRELVLNEGDLLTDLCREILSREGMRVVKASAMDHTGGQPESARRGTNDLHQEKAAPSASHKYDLVIANGTVMLPESGAISANIGIRDGKVESIGTNSMEAEKTIDAKGLLVLPGIIDPHTHMGLFAPLDTDLYTETQSAILGGVTTIGCFFNQTGSYLPLLRRLESLVPQRSCVDLFPHFTIRDEEQLQEIDKYVQEGITSFKMYMCGIPDLFPAQEDGFIVKVLETLKRLPEKTLMCVHAENTSIVEYASTDDQLKSVSTLAEWAKTHPDLAEGEAINRAVYFSNKLDFPIYVVHVSSRDGVEVIRNNSFRKGYIETTSPYLTIDQDDDIAAKGKMLPPLRDRASRDSLWEALENGYIDTIGTDNTKLL